jgi:hypothetical protein
LFFVPYCSYFEITGWISVPGEVFPECFDDLPTSQDEDTVPDFMAAILPVPGPLWRAESNEDSGGINDL